MGIGAGGRGGTSQSRGRGGRGSSPRTVRQFKNGNYCWLHGHNLYQNYISMTWNWPAEGEQATTTKANPMNGSQRRGNLGK